MVIEWIEVKSDNLDRVAYERDSHSLYVIFHYDVRQRKIYRYFPVAPALYRGLMESTSKGRYFNENIRSVYGPGFFDVTSEEEVAKAS